MKDKFNAFKQKLESFATKTPLVYLAGTVTGSIVTGAIIYYKMEHDRDQLLTLSLGKEAFEALVNNETDVVRFWTGKHNHIFRVTLEQ